MWYLGGVDPATTIAFFFEVTNTNATPLPPHKRRYMQFLTSYQAATGRFRLRVTTVCGLWHSDPADHLPIAQSFDQVSRRGSFVEGILQRVTSIETRCNSRVCRPLCM